MNKNEGVPAAKFLVRVTFPTIIFLLNLHKKWHEKVTLHHTIGTPKNDPHPQLVSMFISVSIVYGTASHFARSLLVKMLLLLCANFSIHL